MNRFILSTIILMAAGLASTPSRASEWGCEVLLCAASSNPSWRAVTSCHPPMEKLLSAMKRPGFTWPTCPEGGAGKPGYEQYAECPAGWTPTSGSDGGGDGFSREESRCSRQVMTCDGHSRRFGTGGREATPDGITRVFSGNNACTYTEFQARPRRADPYYFDIKDSLTGDAKRHWFSLSQ